MGDTTMFKFLRSAVLATGILALGAGGANAVSFTVDSLLNSSNTGNGYATGLNFTAGQGFTVTADPLDTWSLGSEDPSTRTSNANGITSYYGNYGQGNLSTLFGTLVGRIGNGDFFIIGTNFVGTALNSGQLFLFNWDSYEGDNTGSITANVSAVPLPPGVVLAGSALLLLGAMGMKRKRADA
jgi:hypothetical protein